MVYFKHGHSTAARGQRTATYKTWASMKQRCTDPNCASYPAYGGRGITFDPRWLEFSNFLADMGERPRGHSLHRIDNDKPYCKENCRWATYREQSAMVHGTIMLTIDGERMNAEEAARRHGLNGATLRNRLARGVPLSEALKKPKMRRY